MLPALPCGTRSSFFPAMMPWWHSSPYSMTADAKKLEEGEQTGAQKFSYIKTFESHYSFAATYALMAASHGYPGREVFEFYRGRAAQRGAQKGASIPPPPAPSGGPRMGHRLSAQ